MKEFADNLKRLRKERGMSQGQLAKISCIPIKTIQNYEQNRYGHSATFHNVMLLADILEVAPYKLYFGGTDNMETLYMKELLSELSRLSPSQVEEIHDSEANGISLPKLAMSDQVINDLKHTWNKKVAPPQRGYYRPYVEQTIIRYAQDRQGWKEKFNLFGEA